MTISIKGIEPSVQNSRVSNITVDIKDISQPNQKDVINEIIEKCYRQILFSPLKYDREPCLESQLRTGSITVKEFIRGVLISPKFYNNYIRSSNNYRVVEQIVGRVLGRYVYNDNEKINLSIIIAKDGFPAFIDSILNSNEYMEKFGEDRVPSQTKRVLPGKSTGEIPIYQRLPRYGEDWRDFMVINKLMFSIEDHKKYTIYLKPPVESLIYEKPKGRNGLIYTIFILVLSIVSLQLILLIAVKTFTIR